MSLVMSWGWVSATTTFGIPEWGRVTVIDAVWLALGVAGLVITGWKSRKIFNDQLLFFSEEYASLELDTRKAMRIVWQGHLRRERYRFVQMLGVTVLGAWASLQPSLVHPSVITITGLILTGVLTLIVGINVVQSLKDSHDARRVNEILGPHM